MAAPDKVVAAEAFLRRDTVGFWSRIMISGIATVGMLDVVVTSATGSRAVEGSAMDDPVDSVLGASSNVSVDLVDDEEDDGNSSVTGGAVYVE